jgi:hypothetical protein
LRKLLKLLFYINDPVKAAFGDLLFFNAAQFKVFSYEKANFCNSTFMFKKSIEALAGRKSVIKESCFQELVRESSKLYDGFVFGI